MKKFLIFLTILGAALITESCNNNSQETPSKAGTADTSHTSNSAGTATPYGGDSVTNKMADSSSRK